MQLKQVPTSGVDGGQTSTQSLNTPDECPECHKGVALSENDIVDAAKKNITCVYLRHNLGQFGSGSIFMFGVPLQSSPR
jgi:hypothetical protein